MTKRADMRMITMREFRTTFAGLDEAVKVVRARGKIEVVGIWTPVKPNSNGQEAKEVAQ